jgi:hypothetical protein
VTLFDAQYADRVFLLVSVLALVAAQGVLVWRLNIPDFGVVASTIGFFALGPAEWGLIFFTQSPVLSLVSVLLIFAILRRKDLSTGALLAIAGTLKLFPLILLLPLVRWGRLRAVWGAIGLLAALNLLPLLLDHVALDDVISAMSGTVGNWFELGPNISLAALVNGFVEVGPRLRTLIGLVSFILTILVIRRWPLRDETGALSFAMAAALLTSPLSWTHYVLLLMPFMVVWAADGRSPRLVVILGLSWLLMVPLLPAYLYSIAVLVSLALVLIGARSPGRMAHIALGVPGSTDKSLL